jgi:hypothetical protein
MITQSSEGGIVSVSSTACYRKLKVLERILLEMRHYFAWKLNRAENVSSKIKDKKFEFPRFLLSCEIHLCYRGSPTHSETLIFESWKKVRYLEALSDTGLRILRRLNSFQRPN